MPQQAITVVSLQKSADKRRHHQYQSPSSTIPRFQFYSQHQPSAPADVCVSAATSSQLWQGRNKQACPWTRRQMFEDQTLMHKEPSKDPDKATSEISGEVKRRANRYRGCLLHELICASGSVWLDAQDRKALRITDGSQRLLIPTEVSCGATLLGCVLGGSRVLLQIGIALKNDTVPYEQAKLSPCGSCLFVSRDRNLGEMVELKVESFGSEVGFF